MRALASQNYKFEERFDEITDSAKESIVDSTGASLELYQDLAFQGVSVLVNATDNNLNGDQGLQFFFYVSSNPSEKQEDVLLELYEYIECNCENEIDISQYHFLLPKYTKDIIYTEDEMMEILNKVKARKIINLQYKKKGNDYICSYMSRDGDFTHKGKSFFSDLKNKKKGR